MSKFNLRTPADLDRAAKHILALNLDKPWVLELGRGASKRTLSQNALYWKWIGIIASETGNSPKTTHDALKDEFCPPSEVKLGPLTKMVCTTTELEVAAMSEYMNHVQAFAETNLGIFLPIPEEMQRND